MTAPKFITLTGGLNPKPLRIRADRIDAFERLDRVTAVYVGSETYKVTETPEQIDALLGVTAIDLKPLERLLRSLGFAEWATPEGAQACLEEALKLHGEAKKTFAALASATGTEG